MLINCLLKINKISFLNVYKFLESIKGYEVWIMGVVQIEVTLGGAKRFGVRKASSYALSCTATIRMAP